MWRLPGVPEMLVAIVTSNTGLPRLSITLASKAVIVMITPCQSAALAPFNKQLRTAAEGGLRQAPQHLLSVFLHITAVEIQQVLQRRHHQLVFHPTTAVEVQRALRRQHPQLAFPPTMVAVVQRRRRSVPDQQVSRLWLGNPPVQLTTTLARWTLWVSYTTPNVASRLLATMLNPRTRTLSASVSNFVHFLAGALPLLT